MTQPSTPPPAAPPPAAVDLSTREVAARAFVNELAAGRYASAMKTFDDTMRAAVPEDKLAAAWGGTVAAAGGLQGIDGSRVVEEGGYHVVHVTARFEKGRRDLKVVYGADDRIAGFFITPVEADLEAAAKALVDKLAHGDNAGATAGFDDTMRAALPADKLGAVWAQLQGQAGAFGGIEEARVKREGGHYTAYVTCRFAKAKLAAKVVFDAQARIAGLFFVPAENAADWQPPAYARADAFTERAVQVGSAPALPGTLTLPKGAGPFPVVVLVHGSGPQDADESVSAAKPFKDLAWGLASRGIAVLRYVKRTRHSPGGVVTVKEEVLDAARDAVALCRATPELDPKRVVVAGHSQGAELAPRIAAENPGVAAIVMLAAPSRPLQELVVDQFTYFAKLDPQNAALAKNVEAAKAFKQRVEDPALKPDEEVALPGGVTLKGAYLLSMRGYEPAKVAAGLKIPILVLQGDRDYQVTAPDLEGYKKALGKKPNVTIKQYPALNHLFVAGSGTPQPSEYDKPGHVDEAVLADIAAFVGKLPR